MRYTIKYTETYFEIYEIEADSKEEAEEKLREMIAEDRIDGPEQCENSNCEFLEEDNE